MTTPKTHLCREPAVTQAEMYAPVYYSLMLASDMQNYHFHKQWDLHRKSNTNSCKAVESLTLVAFTALGATLCFGEGSRSSAGPRLQLVMTITGAAFSSLFGYCVCRFFVAAKKSRRCEIEAVVHQNAYKRWKDMRPPSALPRTRREFKRCYRELAEKQALAVESTTGKKPDRFCWKFYKNSEKWKQPVQ